MKDAWEDIVKTGISVAGKLAWFYLILVLIRELTNGRVLVPLAWISFFSITGYVVLRLVSNYQSLIVLSCQGYKP